MGRGQWIFLLGLGLAMPSQRALAASHAETEKNPAVDVEEVLHRQELLIHGLAHAEISDEGLELLIILLERQTALNLRSFSELLTRIPPASMDIREKRELVRLFREELVSIETPTQAEELKAAAERVRQGYAQKRANAMRLAPPLWPNAQYAFWPSAFAPAEKKTESAGAAEDEEHGKKLGDRAGQLLDSILASVLKNKKEGAKEADRRIGEKAEPKKRPEAEPSEHGASPARERRGKSKTDSAGSDESKRPKSASKSASRFEKEGEPGESDKGETEATDGEKRPKKKSANFFSPFGSEKKSETKESESTEKNESKGKEGRKALAPIASAEGQKEKTEATEVPWGGWGSPARALIPELEPGETKRPGEAQLVGTVPEVPGIFENLGSLNFTEEARYGGPKGPAYQNADGGGGVDMGMTSGNLYAAPTEDEPKSATAAPFEAGPILNLISRLKNRTWVLDHMGTLAHRLCPADRRHEIGVCARAPRRHLPLDPHTASLE